MPPSEPIHETIAENLRLALAAIDASAHPNDYFYGPGEAFRCRAYEERYFADEFRLIVMLRSGGASRQIARESNCGWDVTRQFFVLACVKEDDASTFPWDTPADGGKKPTTAQERLLADVEKALADDTLGGLAYRVDIPNVEYGLEHPSGGWTIVEAELSVEYTAPRRTVN